MIDTKNRLFKLLRQCDSYTKFESRAIAKSGWVLAPYVTAGHIITKAWLIEFYMLNKGGK